MAWRGEGLRWFTYFGWCDSVPKPVLIPNTLRLCVGNMLVETVAHLYLANSEAAIFGMLAV